MDGKRMKWGRVLGVAGLWLILAAPVPFGAGCTTDPGACKSECPVRALFTYELIFQMQTRNCTTDTCVQSARTFATMQMALAQLTCESTCTTDEAKKNPLRLPF